MNCLQKRERPAGEGGPWVTGLKAADSLSSPAFHFLRTLLFLLGRGVHSAACRVRSSSSRKAGSGEASLSSSPSGGRRAQRFGQPAGIGEQPFRLGRHLLLLVIGKKLGGLFALHFRDGLEDLLLLDAAEIVGGGGDEALRAHVEVQRFGELQGMAALVRALDQMLRAAALTVWPAQWANSAC